MLHRCNKTVASSPCRTSLRTVARTLGLLIAMSLLSGCVWLRLLETKQQIADFDRNFRVEATSELSLFFLQPTLLSDDFTYLSGIEPTRSEIVGKGKLNQYDFQKVDDKDNLAPGPKGDLVFRLTFDAEERLVRWDFSPVFLAIAPPAFLEASIRSLGSAAVDQDKRRVSADTSLLPKVAAQLPPRSDVVAALGEPAETRNHPDGLLYIYRFRLNGRAVDEEHDKNRYAVAKLYFDPQTDRLVKMSSRFAGLKIAINYRRLAQTPLETATIH